MTQKEPQVPTIMTYAAAKKYLASSALRFGDPDQIAAVNCIHAVDRWREMHEALKEAHQDCGDECVECDGDGVCDHCGQSCPDCNGTGKCEPEWERMTAADAHAEIDFYAEAYAALTEEKACA